MAVDLAHSGAQRHLAEGLAAPSDRHLRPSTWRDFADSVALKQPFAQLWREVYRPPDPAADADRRFAGQLVRQHALLDLCQQRGWRYSIQGYWDSANNPTLLLPRWNLTAVLEAQPADHKRDDFFFNYLTVGAVQFFHTEGEGLAPQALPLSQVPPLVFSEVLRDRAGVEERWLVVQGPQETFRIHLGTANVRRERDDQPLPVVADREARERAARVFLPFEGDSMLGTILGKAFLLAG